MQLDTSTLDRTAPSLRRLPDAELARIAEATASADPVWAAVVAEQTRRRFLAGTLAAGLSLGLAACGGDDHPTSTDATKRTRVVPSAGGSVRVPADPRRIVTLNPYPFGTLTDLGVTVAGTFDEGEAFVTRPNLSAWQEAPKVGGGSQIDLEKVSALRPDLIIGIANAPYITSVAAQLRQIAPTVLLPFGDDATWQQWSQGTATTVGRSGALGGLARRYRERTSEIRERYAETLSETRWNALQGGFDTGQCWVYGARSPIGGILADAGIRFARASATTTGNSNRKLSYERLGDLSDADAIAYYVTRDGKPANQGPALFSQSGFRRLPAVRKQRLVPFTEFLPGSYGDALAALDELETGLRRLSA